MKELNEYLDCFKDELESEENGDNAFINRGPNFEIIFDYFLLTIAAKNTN